MKGLRIVFLAFLPVIAAVGVFIAHQRKDPGFVPSHSVDSAVIPTNQPCVQPDPKTQHYVGAVLAQPWSLSHPLFKKESGIDPKILEYYVGFGAHFDISRLYQIEYRYSAFPIIQIDPWHAKLAKIAAGDYDTTYLTKLATTIGGFSCPVAISFGHEMNGNWYPWGLKQKPASFIAAWRHIVNLFAKAKVSNVTWIWTVNRVSAFTHANINNWWPGSKYVNWIGLDAYYRHADLTFGDVFSNTLKHVRALSKKDPILITETAVTPTGPQGSNIENLFQEAGKKGIFGVVWFNLPRKADWQLQGRPHDVLIDFKNAAMAYMKEPKAKPHHS